MLLANTWEKAPWAKEEKQTIKNSTRKEPKRTTIEQNNINTWTSPDGQTQRQIDYIMINNKYRNTVRKSWTAQHWRGNMAQQRQHATIILEITLKMVRNYHKKSPPETGNRVKYDITSRREEPAKLEKWHEKQEQQQNHQTPDIQSDWGQLKKNIQQGLQECCPPTKKTKNTPRPDNLDPTILNAHWGEKEEKEQEKWQTEKEVCYKKVYNI